MVVGVSLALVFGGPIAYLVVRLFSDLSAAVDVLSSTNARGPLARTLLLGLSVGVSTAALGTALAWLTTRTNLFGVRLWRALVPLPLVLPSFVGALALVSATSPQGLLGAALSAVGVDGPFRVQGYWAAFTVLTFLTYPYVYLPVAARMAGLPASTEESARALGASPREVFRTVVMPQLHGAIGAGSLLTFLYVVSDFGLVQLLHYDTLTRVIYATRLSDRTTSWVLSLLLGVIALSVVAIERRLTRRKFQAGSHAAGRRSRPVRLGAWRFPATAFVGLIVGVALVLPLASLAQWAARGFGAGSATHVELSELVAPARTSAIFAVLAGALAVVAVLPLAYLRSRYKSRSALIGEAAVAAGFALPGLVIGLALMFWTLQSRVFGFLYLSAPLLIGAYVLHFGAQALGSAQVAVGGVPIRLEEAARSLGASRLRSVLSIDLPLMAPGLAAAFGLVLLSTMKELPATLLLAPIGTETLATNIWGAASEGFYAQAGTAALVLVAVSGVLTWAITLRPMKSQK